MTSLQAELTFRIGQAEGAIAKIGLSEDIAPTIEALAHEMLAVALTTVSVAQREQVFTNLLTMICKEAGDRAKWLQLGEEIKRDAA